MADKQKPVKIQMIVIHNDPPRPRLEDVNPCLVGKHRPAWLVNGQVACGYCGVRL